ncbi:uncharacterized protein BKCO1_6300018 [Diplodia corticola]|uniref:Fe2OG dioxygenase domain-containing protein n=1 Tax=Diplodia corticola TaxID=236234 RepID=A0A1J9RCR1_9PEZI|nr:uncharacterized protein BKCO1_6300018 [Diplodia corticola]OJD30291.1 hypothetical protein BKCO1_6300018 [Diplodia corticola]
MPSAIYEDVLTPAPTPPKVTGPTTKRATRPTNKLPQSLIDGSRVEEKAPFDAEKHLVFQAPEKIYTMEEIGLRGSGISPNAVSEPFPLFSGEAIRQMRAEIFSDASIEQCQYASTFNKNMIRGMGPERAPFIHDAWSSPEVLSKISQVAGIELVPALDFDIANINISTGDTTVDLAEAEKQQFVGDDVSAVAWHYDSYPFVCVTMLSDCTDMVGGETALRTATGDVMKVRGPVMGSAVVLQGRYIEHQALKAFGGRERITMVTSLRAKSPHVKDETILTGVRGISDLSAIYTQYTEYRLQILEERIRERLRMERRREVAKRPFDIEDTRKWLVGQRGFVDAMLQEIYAVGDD